MMKSKSERGQVKHMPNGFASSTRVPQPLEKGPDSWHPAMQKIDDHLRSLLRPGAGFEQSFFWRVIGREFARNPLRRLVVGAEVAVISPRPASLNYARALVAESSLLAEGSERRLEDYVSFTRADFHPLDKLSCDWCAVCNGLLAWTGDLLDDALRHPDLLSPHWRFDGNHPYRHAFKALRWLPMSAAQRSYDSALVAAQVAEIRARAQQQLAGAELDAFMRAARHFVVVRHNAACIEQRYCPFRHLRALAYAPDYCVYDWRLAEHVEMAARVLAERGAVDCHDCAAVLNSSPLVPADDTPSIVEDFFELLCRTSTGERLGAAQAH